MRTNLFCQLAAVTVLAFGFTPGVSQCHAASYTLIGSGDWSVAANWSPNGVPGPDDTATINGGIVTVSTDTTVSNLNLIDGIIAGSAVLSVVSNFTWTAGTMSGSGRTRLLASCTGMLSGGNKYLQEGRRLENAGNTTWQDGEIIVGLGSGGDSGRLINLTGGVFDVTVDGHSFRDKDNSNCPNPNVAIMENYGTLRRSSGNGVARLGLAQCGGSVTGLINYGAIDVQTGTLILEASGFPVTDSGSYAVAAGATLGFSGNRTRTINTDLNLAGDIVVYGSTVNLAGDLFAHDISVSGGALTVQDQAGVRNVSISSIYGGTLNFNGTGIITNLTLAEGALGGSGLINVASNFTWTGGTMTGNGTTRLLEHCVGVLTGSNSKSLQGGRRWENGGVTTWQDGEIIVGSGPGGDSGTFVNLESGLFEVTVEGHNFRDKENSNCPNPNTTVIINRGMLRRTGSGAVTLGLPLCGSSIVLVNNLGSVEVQSGTLVLGVGPGTANDTGSFVVATGATLGFTGNGTRNVSALNLEGHLSVSGSAVNVSGGLNAPTLDLSGGSLTVQGQAVIGSASVTMANGGGTLNFDGPGTITNLMFTGGTLGGSGFMNVVSNFTWTAGAMSGSGTTRLLEHCVGTLSGSGSKFLQGGRRWENDGTTTWQDGEIIVGSGPGGDSGTFVNLARGVFDITVDGHNFRDNDGNCNNPITTVIVNEGTLRRSGGNGSVTLGLPSCNLSSSSISNAGTIESQSGTLRFGGSFVQTGGATHLDGGNVAAGLLRIQGGTLSGTGAITGNVTSSGIVSPGASPGLLTISGNYTQSTAGTLNIEINGTDPGTSFDRLAVTGTVSLNGTNNVFVANGFTAPSGTKLKFLTAGTLSGLLVGSFSRFNYELDYGQLLPLSYQRSGASKGVEVEIFIPPMVLSPASISLLPGETQAFTVAEGKPPRTFSLDVPNSGGSIDGVSGLYTAGPVHSLTDTVRVTDSLGATATASVFVMNPLITISGKVMSGGSGIAGAVIFLLNQVGSVGATLGDEDGNYVFADLPAKRDYVLIPGHNHYVFDPREIVVFSPRVNYVTNIVGTRVNYRVFGRVANPAGGISGATVRELGGSGLVAETDSDGWYAFNQVPSGSTVTISVTKVGYAFGADQTFLITGDSQAHFAGSVLLRSITGAVTNFGGSGISGVKIIVLSNSVPLTNVLTSGTGEYGIGDLPADVTYVLAPSKTDVAFTPSTRTVSLLQGNATKVDFRGFECFRILGSLVDSSNAGIGGATVFFRREGDVDSAVPTSDRGTFISPGLLAGFKYVVQPSKPNHTFTPFSTFILLNSDKPGVNFTGAVPLISVSGRVTNDLGQRYGGMKVSLTGPTNRTAFTLSDGSFVFNNLPGLGNYVLKPVRTNFTMQPASVTFDPAGQNVSRSFRATPLLPLNGRIVASKTVGGSYRVRIMNADGTEQVTFTSSLGGGGVLSPDGRRIAFEKQGALFVANSDGSGQSQITANVGPRRYAWSKDSLDLSFAVPSQGLFVVDADRNQQPRRVVNIDWRMNLGAANSDPGDLIDGFSTWSPDGTELLFGKWFQSGSGVSNSYIFKVRTNVGSGITLVTRNAALPAWSPDGTKLAYLAGNLVIPGVEGELAVANPDGTGAQYLTLDNSSGPTWSPDSSMLACEAFNELYAIRANGSLKTPIADGIWPSWGRTPRFSTTAGTPVTVTNGYSTVRFANVTSPGTTTIIPAPAAVSGALPRGYVSIAGAGMNYEISTTADYSGSIRVCFTVPSISSLATFNSLRVMHGENGKLVDRTIRSPNSPAPNFATRTICADVPSLSPFTIAMEVDTNMPMVIGLVVDEHGNPIPEIALDLGMDNPRQTLSDINGLFTFANLEAGSNYTIVPLDGRYNFTPPLAVLDEVAGTNLIAFIAVPKPEPNRIFDVALESGVLNFSFVTGIGKTHTIQYNDSLTSTNWLPLTNFIGDGLIWRLSDPLSPTPPVAQRFYRIVTQ